MFSNLTWMALLFVAILTPPVFVRLRHDRSIKMEEMILAMVVMGLATIACFYVGKNFKISDNQIISGEIVDKVREHGFYTETYDCNCVDGKCQTCSRTIYTVEWYAVANIAKIEIDSARSEYRSVYNKADPARYTNIIIGEPASTTRTFRNYIAATPDSVFHNRSVDPLYAKLMPAYPGQVYDFYRINRVLTLGNVPVNASEWNQTLAQHMKKWGYQNKGNVILVFTDIANRGFTESLKNHWLQGKQNDIVVIFGLEQNKILWADVFSWTENETFKLELADSLRNLENLNKDAVFSTIDSHMKDFKYRDMGTDFEYLDHMVAPHIVWVPLAYLISILLAIGSIALKRKHFR